MVKPMQNLGGTYETDQQRISHFIGGALLYVFVNVPIAIVAGLDQFEASTTLTPWGPILLAANVLAPILIALWRRWIALGMLATFATMLAITLVGGGVTGAATCFRFMVGLNP